MMTRREVLLAAARSLSATWFFGFVKQSDGGREIARRNMPDGIDWSNSRAPVWRHPHLFVRACSSDLALHPVQNDAVASITEAERGLLGSHPNRHVLWMGPQKRLHEAGFAKEAFLSVKSILRLDVDWSRQREGFIEVFCRFFSPDDRGVGIFSVTSARRPAYLRDAEATRIVVKAAGAPEMSWVSQQRIQHPNPTIWLGDDLSAGSFELPVGELHFARGSDGAHFQQQFAKLQVRRIVSAHNYNVPAYYDEMWVCRARRGDDNERLRKGQIPAIKPERYEGLHARLRTTPIVNLWRLDSKLRCTLLSMEINPSSSEFLSMRFSFLPLGVVLLNAAPVEHAAICQALRKLLSTSGMA
jgi:hypothetical protein